MIAMLLFPIFLGASVRTAPTIRFPVDTLLLDAGGESTKLYLQNVENSFSIGWAAELAALRIVYIRGTAMVIVSTPFHPHPSASILLQHAKVAQT